MEGLSRISKAGSKLTIDPVCGMNVSPEKTELAVDYKGMTYCFCAEVCRKAFEKDPQSYLQTKSPKRKGLWGRYLDRLEKATRSKPLKCH